LLLSFSALFVVSEKLITKLTTSSEGNTKSETVYRLHNQKKSGPELPLLTSIEYIKTKDNDMIFAGYTVILILNS